VVDERITLVELASGQERAVVDLLPPAPGGRFRGIETAARSLAWLGPRELAVGCRDGLIRRYDIVSGERLLPLSGHQREVVALRVLPDRRHLLSLGRDGRLCRWDLETARRSTSPPPPELSSEAWERHWEALADSDLQQQHRARLAIAQSANGVRLLAAKVSPVAAVAPGKAAELARGIASEDYNERRQAAAELRALGERAIPILRQAAAARDNEFASSFLSRLESQPAAVESARTLQAVQVLQESDSPLARESLSALARGAPEADLTRRAAQALEFAVRSGAAERDVPPLDALWEQLAAEEAARGWQAAQALAARGDALSFLRKRLAAAQQRFAAEEDPQSVERLIEQLDAEDFAAREAASQALLQQGDRLHPLLRKRLATTTSSEQKMRLERLLQARAARPAGLRLQVERAAEALFLCETAAPLSE
jgi:hypothetical protein